MVTAVFLFIAAGNAPAVGLDPVYFDIHVVVFFALLGGLAAIGVNTEAAKQRLVAIYVITTGVVATGIMWTTVADPVRSIPFVAAGVVLAAAAAALQYSGVSSKSWLYHLSGFLASFLLIFGLIYLGALTLQNQNIRYLVPLVIAVPVYVAVLSCLRESLSTTSP